MDIVYLYKNSGRDEIIYSLRSLENIPHDKVFIVGDCHKYINKEKVIYIPAENNGSKYHNTTANLKLACQDERLSDDFILMNDDFFILKPIKEPKEELNFHKGTIDKVVERLLGRYSQGSEYIRGMAQTGELLKKIGIEDPLCYELHIPFVLNKHNFLQMFKDFADDIAKIKCFHKRSFYGNLYYKDSKFMTDIKTDGVKNLFPQKEQKFISSSDFSFDTMKFFLKDLLSKKSIYERSK